MLRPTPPFHRPLAALLAATLPLAVSATTLSEAVRHAVAHHPEVAAADHERAATAEELARARGAYLPQLDATVEYGRERADSDASGVSDDSPTRRLGLTLNQSLYDPAKLREIDRQRSRLDAAAEGLRSRAEEVALEAVASYLEVWRDERVVELSERNVARHRATLTKVEGRLAAGEGGLGDVKQAESRLTNARATRVDNLRVLEQDRASYRRVVGLEASDLALPVLSAERLPHTLEAAVEQALDHNPALRRAEAEVAAADAALGAAKAGFLPTLDAEVSANEADNAGGVGGDSDDLRAMLVLRYNLYAGGGDRARKREAAARRLVAVERLNSLHRRLEERTRRAWVAKARSDEKRRLLEAQQTTADRVVEIYRKEFEIGRHSLLDLLDSESERFNVEVRRIDAEKEALLARYQLLAAMGRLNRVIDQAIDRPPPPPKAETTPATKPAAEAAPPKVVKRAAPRPAEPTPAPATAKPAPSTGEEAAWVVLIAEDRTAAEALAEQVAAHGYRRYIAAIGGGRHAVSVGLFREKGNANRLAAELRGHGFHPTLLPKRLPAGRP